MWAETRVEREPRFGMGRSACDILCPARSSRSKTPSRRRSFPATIGTLFAVLLAGCASSSEVGLPATTTTEAFTHAQVLSWVTPTLQNGITLVGSAPPGATDAQLFASSRPLNTAASVSTNELSQITWRGPLRSHEEALVRALRHIEALTMAPPGANYLSQLSTDIRTVQLALQRLTDDVKG